jgi:tRNA threonylcarbamoyladenosine biosynthesis protein TsaE
MIMKTMRVAAVEDWQSVARELVKTIKPGMILELSGPLGAGKTTFVQALARELGSKTEPKSPTFALVRSYALPKSAANRAPIRLVHVDAYRIEKPEDIVTLGLDELLAEPGTIMAIEWPENIATWLSRPSVKKIHVRITVREDGSRTVVLT